MESEYLSNAPHKREVPDQGNESRNWKIEQQFRQDLFPDVKEIKNYKLVCTACGCCVKSLMLQGKPIIHPFMETLLCERCRRFYGDGEFALDEDGTARYCRWCGQGGTLYLCSQCTTGFCKSCVRRNLSRHELAKLKLDTWVCYCCDMTPLYKLRALCWAAQQYSKGASLTKNFNRKPPQDSDCSESEGDTLISHKKRKEGLRKKRNILKKKRYSEDFESNGRRKRRLLRRRNSKFNPVTEQSSLLPSSATLPSGLSIVSVRAVVTKLSIFISDITGITKATHKQLMDFKRKELVMDKYTSEESIMHLYSKLSSIMLILITTLQDVSKISKLYVEKWCRVMMNELKANEKKAAKEEETTQIVDEQNKSPNNQSTKLEVFVVYDSDEEFPTNEQTPSILNKLFTKEADGDNKVEEPSLSNETFIAKKTEDYISNLYHIPHDLQVETSYTTSTKKASTPSSSVE